MSMVDKPCKVFITELASKTPVPGGGGAAAMGGAIGMALSNMVGNLTIGKRKYIKFEEEVKDLISKGELILVQLQALVDKDAEVFEPLSKAYGLPQNTPEQAKVRKETIENYSKVACLAPLEIMQRAYEGIKIHERMEQIGSPLAISDVGCGTVLLKAALTAASLNILINLRTIQDQNFVKETRDKMDHLLNEGSNIADKVLQQVITTLTK
jgi:formiminotetrahydrofolate cyclodeaminase